MNFLFVNVIIFRQAGTGAWQRIHTVFPLSPFGVFEDAAAPIATLSRYSAITEYVDPAKPGDNAGSDAAPYRELDYGLATYGMKGRRDEGDPDHTLAPPGFALTGHESDRNRFQTVALTFDDQSPSFIPTNPALPANTVAPLDFVKEQDRFFVENRNEAELSTEGYVIRGRKFNIKGYALVPLSYSACWLGFPPLPIAPQPVAKPVTGNNQKQRFELKSTPIRFLGTRYQAPAPDGFDDATYFASQHLPGGTPGQERPMKLLLEGSGESPTVSKITGSFILSGSSGDDKELSFTLRANTTALEENGEVEESTTKRKLKVVSLRTPEDTWTVGLYRVRITELDGTTKHEGPNPPTQAAVNDVLNNTFGKQANVTFAAGVVKDIELKLAELATPISYPPWLFEIMNALQAKVTENPKPDFMLFWVPDFKPSYFAGQAFGTPSHGAVIRGGQSTRTVAHEIGHCLGLEHCWMPNPNGSQLDVPDTEDKRLMGYRGGFLLRSQEIIIVNKWKRP